MEASWTDPSAGSSRSCSQLANSFPSLLLEHLLMCGDYQVPTHTHTHPPHCSLPSTFRLLINPLEAASPGAEGGSGARDYSLGFGSNPLGAIWSLQMTIQSDIAHRHGAQHQKSVHLVWRFYSNVCLMYSIRNQCIWCGDLTVMSALCTRHRPDFVDCEYPNFCWMLNTRVQEWPNESNWQTQWLSS